MEIYTNNSCYKALGVMSHNLHSSLVKDEQDLLKDHLVIANSGQTVFTVVDNIELSDGCKACKTGNWVCIFVGPICNLRCDFCPRDHSQEYYSLYDTTDTFCGTPISILSDYTKMYNIVKGVSYSGGEPMLYVDKFIDFVRDLAQIRPDVYQWVYTNGVEATPDRMQLLADAGINEIRFDLAATNFSDRVISNLKAAVHIFKRVTVEIPSLPSVKQKLIDEGYLKFLVDIGVTQLNLAEMELIADINWDNYAQNDTVYFYNSDTFSATCLSDSRLITYDIIKFSVENNFNILINDCSIEAKHLQCTSANKTGIFRP